MAAPMSPLILIFPAMYAVVAFCWPLTIRSKFSAELEMVTSPWPLSPSLTSSEPPRTATVQTPAPAMSNTYVLLTPAVLPGSTLADNPSKNSFTLDTRPPLARGTAGQRDRARSASDEEEDEHEARADEAADDDHRAPPVAVGERPGGEGADSAGEEHQREQVVAVRLRVPERDLPERYERQQAEPRE